MFKEKLHIFWTKLKIQFMTVKMFKDTDSKFSTVFSQEYGKKFDFIVLPFA